LHCADGQKTFPDVIHTSVAGLQHRNRTDAKITKLGKPSSIFKYIYKNKGEPE
jgi:hypothetical protein